MILRTFHFRLLSLLVFVAISLAACVAAETIVIPTAQPTATATATPTGTRQPGADTTPTVTVTRAALLPTEGPSPTPLFGEPAAGALPTSTRPFNPNAPRIEFFTTNVLSAAPGNSITLFWSARGANTAQIYRLDPAGNRTQLWNVGPDGQLAVDTRRADRGEARFVLSIGEGINRVEQTLAVPLSCPDTWFFTPPPTACPSRAAVESGLIEEPFERGRMVYVASSNLVYALFNDGFQPAWVSLENRYDPSIHPEFEESFQPPPGFYQPLRILGFTWRGNDRIRSRLGLALQPEFTYQGFIQAAPAPNGVETLYISSADGSVLELVPAGAGWQIITPG